MCRRHPRITVQELLSVLEITKQALHGPLEELVERKLVDKVRDPADGRTRRLVLTGRGRELEERLSAPQRAAFAGAFDAVPSSGVAAWAAVMRELAGGKSEGSLLG
jgi:DNA-binding MarR family transcriptional regulator